MEELKNFHVFVASYTLRTFSIILRRVGGVNCILDDSRLSPTKSLKSEHIHIANATQERKQFSRVGLGGVIWVLLCRPISLWWSLKFCYLGG